MRNVQTQAEKRASVSPYEDYRQMPHCAKWEGMGVKTTAVQRVIAHHHLVKRFKSEVSKWHHHEKWNKAWWKCGVTTIDQGYWCFGDMMDMIWSIMII